MPESKIRTNPTPYYAVLGLVLHKWERISDFGKDLIEIRNVLKFSQENRIMKESKIKDKLKKKMKLSMPSPMSSIFSNNSIMNVKSGLVSLQKIYNFHGLWMWYVIGVTKNGRFILWTSAKAWLFLIIISRTSPCSFNIITLCSANMSFLFYGSKF